MGRVPAGFSARAFSISPTISAGHAGVLARHAFIYGAAIDERRDIYAAPESHA